MAKLVTRGRGCIAEILQGFPIWPSRGSSEGIINPGVPTTLALPQPSQAEVVTVLAARVRADKVGENSGQKKKRYSWSKLQGMQEVWSLKWRGAAT